MSAYEPPVQRPPTSLRHDDPSRHDEPYWEPAAERPLPAPRPIPPGTNGVAGGTVFLMVGLMFAFIGGVIMAVGIGLVITGAEGGWFMALIPSVHFTLGMGLVIYALRGRAERRRIVSQGAVAIAVVDDVGLDPSLRVNGKMANRMTYTFQVDGRNYSGKHRTMNETINRHRSDDRIWVLYDPDDPSKNVEWPPL